MNFVFLTSYNFFLVIYKNCNHSNIKKKTALPLILSPILRVLFYYRIILVHSNIIKQIAINTYKLYLY